MEDAKSAEQRRDREEAEAEAAANGREPFARQPDLPSFDPELESRWSIVMTVAWIAWRDIELVRQNSSVFATFLKLSLRENFLTAENTLPSTAQLSLCQAEAALWKALADGKLIAEALDIDGRPTDVPQREWSYLKLFEERERDVLKYGPLEREVPFRDVKIKREDIFRMWPAVPVRVPIRTGDMIEPIMFQLLTDAGQEGYVPLCVAMHWIMTGGGVRQVALDDNEAWTAASEKLRLLIQTGEVGVIGLPRGASLPNTISGQTFGLIKLRSPVDMSFPDELNAPSFIECVSFVDKDDWLGGDNDRLFERGEPTATWSHLQVKKADILSRWPRPGAKIKAGIACRQWLSELMDPAQGQVPIPKATLWTTAKKKFITISKRQFLRAWDEAIAATGGTVWSKSGPRTGKSNHRTS